MLTLCILPCLSLQVSQMATPSLQSTADNMGSTMPLSTSIQRTRTSSGWLKSRVLWSTKIILQQILKNVLIKLGPVSEKSTKFLMMAQLFLWLQAMKKLRLNFAWKIFEEVSRSSCLSTRNLLHFHLKLLLSHSIQPLSVCIRAVREKNMSNNSLKKKNGLADLL
jgi:hypothetical protein